MLRYFNAAGADFEGRIGEWHSPETHAIPLAIETALGRREFFSIFGEDYDTATAPAFVTISTSTISPTPMSAPWNTC